MGEAWTPGPWKVDTPYDNDITSTVGGGDICTTLNVEVVGRELTVADTVKASREEAWANARLIAAAPDMVSALDTYADQLCEGWCEQSPDFAHFDDCGGCLARRVAWQARGGAKANGETAA